MALPPFFTRNFLLKPQNLYSFHYLPDFLEAGSIQPPLGYSPGWSPVTSWRGAEATAQGHSGIPWSFGRSLVFTGVSQG